MTGDKNDVSDPLYQKAVEIISKALTDVAAVFSESTGSRQLMIGDFVVVAEWLSLEGDRFVTRYVPVDMPPWRRNGLLEWAAMDWGAEHD